MRGCLCSVITGFVKLIDYYILTTKGSDKMDTLYVGIDVSSKTNVAYIMLPNGDKHSNFSVANSPEGSKQLVQRAIKTLKEHALNSIKFGIEATSVYGEGLTYFLCDYAPLSSVEKQIFVLNPKQVHAYKQIYNDLPKNDFVDSFVIADCMRFGRINSAVNYGDYRYTALKQLTRERYNVVKRLVTEKQHLMNVLFKKYSSLAQNKVFSNTFDATALSVYENFDSAEQLAQMDLHELTAFIQKSGRNRFSDPEAVADAISKAVRGSYRLPKTVNDSVNQVLSFSIASIKTLEKQIKEYDKAISAQMEALPQVLTSIPGIGPVFSAGIVAEIGNINKFKNQASLAKYAGLTWTQHQSGNYEAQTTRLINSRNRYLKFLCYLYLTFYRWTFFSTYKLL